ncbi:MAG: AzlC family ABC transporter permease [Anaerolineaceae bacterium]
MSALNPTPHPSRLREFLTGIQTTLPILLGVAPSGILFGVLAIQAGLSITGAQGMSLIVFAGSAQFIMLQLLIAGAPVVVIVLTAFVVNLRHALYSASIAPFLKQLTIPWKLLMGYLLVDEAYSIGIARYMQEDAGPYKKWFYLGSGLILWTCWQTSTAVGIIFGQGIPSSWSLDFALPLTFIALVVPMIKDRAGLAAALVAGVLSVALFGLPNKLSIIVAALAGIAAGLWSERT